MAERRIGGIMFIKADAALLRAKGEFTYSIGSPKREMIPGQSEILGYKEEPAVPFCEGSISDHSELDLQALTLIKNATITLELANGKTFVLREAVYAAEGTVTTGEGEIEVRFEGISAEEIPA